MAHEHPSQHTVHVSSVQSNLIVFGVLMLLLVVTVGVAYLDLGALGLLIALLIASAKATLIILYFMHVRHGTRLQAVFAFSAFFWLAILILLTLADYLTRTAVVPYA